MDTHKQTRLQISQQLKEGYLTAEEIYQEQSGSGETSPTSKDPMHNGVKFTQDNVHLEDCRAIAKNIQKIPPVSLSSGVRSSDIVKLNSSEDEFIAWLSNFAPQFESLGNHYDPTSPKYRETTKSIQRAYKKALSDPNLARRDKKSKSSSKGSGKRQSLLKDLAVAVGTQLKADKPSEIRTIQPSY